MARSRKNTPGRGKPADDRSEDTPDPSDAEADTGAGDGAEDSIAGEGAILDTPDPSQAAGQAAQPGPADAGSGATPKAPGEDDTVSAPPAAVADTPDPSQTGTGGSDGDTAGGGATLDKPQTDAPDASRDTPPSSAVLDTPAKDQTAPAEDPDATVAGTEESAPYDAGAVAPGASDTLAGAAAARSGGPAGGEAAAQPQVVRETVVTRKGGFVPMLLGGVLAAALGYAVALYGDVRVPFLPAPEPSAFEVQTAAAIDAQAGRLDTLEARLEETAAAVEGIDLGPVQTAIETLRDVIDTDVIPRLDDLAATQTTLQERIEGLDARLTEVEKAPLEDAVSPETIAAYERELARLQQAVDDQQAEVNATIEQQQAALAESRARIDEMLASAQQSEVAAERQAELAESRAALADLIGALQAGRPYAAPMQTLTGNGVAVPDALADHAAEGVPTPTVLIAEFPNAARDALRAARVEAEDGADSVVGFFRTQLGARSVTPQDGDDADAVLSRAEAALRDGNLEAALAEIGSLPPAAQEEMADWVALASTRHDALTAADTLAADLNE